MGADPDRDTPPHAERAPGWKQLRLEEEAGFEADFGAIREAIERQELIGSVVELFVSALVGVTRLNLGASHHYDSRGTQSAAQRAGPDARGRGDDLPAPS